MSLGIKIGTEWLDLNPGTQLELEEENPLLQFTDEVVGAYSLPLEVRNTAKNLRLLKYAGLLQQRVETSGIPCQVFDTGIQHSVGRLKVEQPTHNLNHNTAGGVSVYYLTGSSDFSQEAKNLRLRDVDLGGDRTFGINNNDPWSQTGNTFWAHVHQVLRAPVGAYDYAFAPVANADSGFGPVMNDVILGSNLVATYNNRGAVNPIVPFPYLHYVLQRAVAHAGWRIEGDVLFDADFKKIIIVNFRAIDWATGYWIHPFISFNLARHLPDWTIPQFLGNLRRRFGWWYEYDTKARVIRINKLDDVVGANIKDMTRYADPQLAKKVGTERKRYALKNSFTGSYSGAAVDLSKVNLQAPVFRTADLPSPGEARYRHAHLVIAENNYYVCRNNDQGTAWGWYLLQYNCLDVAPSDATDEITTSCTTLGMEYFSNYLDLIPAIDQAVTWGDDEYSDSSMPLLFYHGQQPNKAGQMYPYASSHPFNSQGTQLTDWGLAFECKMQDGRNAGLYDLNWKRMLDTFNSSEDLEVRLYLPRDEMMKLKFSDTIAIANVRMYIRKRKRTLPYSKVVELECVRI